MRIELASLIFSWDEDNLPSQRGRRLIYIRGFYKHLKARWGWEVEARSEQFIMDEHGTLLLQL